MNGPEPAVEDRNQPLYQPRQNPYSQKQFGEKPVKSLLNPC